MGQRAKKPTMLVDDISKKVALELGLKEDLVIKLNRIQYKFMLETIQSKEDSELKNVQLIYIGKIVAKDENVRKTKRYIEWMEKSNIQK